ncbi:MAG: hypothetical protein AXW14_05620 [Alteromonas sp. Nap_26]|nr:MAG: hypothetical protein AXW14_05620 [Alteromonas sp. Nap_26]
MKRRKLHTAIACALTLFTFLAMAPNAIAQEETEVIEEKEAAKNLERIAVAGAHGEFLFDIEGSYLINENLTL